MTVRDFRCTVVALGQAECWRVTGVFSKPSFLVQLVISAHITLGETMLQGQVDLCLTARTIEDLGRVYLLQLQDFMSACIPREAVHGDSSWDWKGACLEHKRPGFLAYFHCCSSLYMVWQYPNLLRKKGAAVRLSEVSNFPFWCLSDRVSGNSGVLLVLVHRRNLLLQNNIYLVMILLVCCWSHSFSKQVSDHMMPWNYFSSLKITFLKETTFGPFTSFAQ